MKATIQPTGNTNEKYEVVVDGKTLREHAFVAYIGNDDEEEEAVTSVPLDVALCAVNCALKRAKAT